MLKDRVIVGNFVQRVRAYCDEEALLSRGDKVLLGVSGGPDSMALLAVFDALREELDLCLYVAHFNHLLRGEESDADAAFVEAQAAARNIPCILGREDVLARQRREGGSLEEVARAARHAFLERTADTLSPQKIALAHHRDDLAETVLMRLLRGSGATGLAGIRPKRREQWIRPGKARVLNWAARNRYWIRPLLAFSKAEILQFLEENAIPFRTDATNADTEFLRNRIRHELLPGLSKDYNPRIRRTLAQTATILAAEDALLQELTDAAWRRVVRSNGIDIERFKLEPVAIQRRLLLRWLRQRLPGQRSPRFDEVERARRYALHPAAPRLCLSRTHQLVVEYHPDSGPRLMVGEGPEGVGPLLRMEQVGGSAEPHRSAAVNLRIPGVTLVDGVAWGVRADVVPADQVDLTRMTPSEAAFDWDEISRPLTFRRWRPGDRFYPFGLQGSKKVSDFLSDLKIPRSRRDEIGVICDDDVILWVVGLRADGRFPVTPQTKDVLYLRAVSLRL